MTLNIFAVCIAINCSLYPKLFHHLQHKFFFFSFRYSLNINSVLTKQEVFRMTILVKYTKINFTADVLQKSLN